MGGYILKTNDDNINLKLSSTLPVDISFTYGDMLFAFATGRRHMKECGDTKNDCWDFATWMTKNYGDSK